MATDAKSNQMGSRVVPAVTVKTEPDDPTDKGSTD